MRIFSLSAHAAPIARSMRKIGLHKKARLYHELLQIVHTVQKRALVGNDEI